MLKIRKGNSTLTVAKSAFVSVFQPAGWVIEENGVAEIVTPPVLESANPDSGVTDPGENGEEDEDETEGEDEDQDSEEEAENEESDEAEDYELTDEELEETPLGELGFEDLKRLAKIKGLDFTGLRSKKELKSLIRANM